MNRWLLASFQFDQIINTDALKNNHCNLKNTNIGDLWSYLQYLEMKKDKRTNFSVYTKKREVRAKKIMEKQIIKFSCYGNCASVLQKIEVTKTEKSVTVPSAYWSWWNSTVKPLSKCFFFSFKLSRIVFENSPFFKLETHFSEILTLVTQRFFFTMNVKIFDRIKNVQSSNI